jgi:hypothetical protein
MPMLLKRTVVGLVGSTTLALALPVRAGGQSLPAWRAIGDPEGAPAGCSVAAAAKGIDAFFDAMRLADSTRLAAATAPSYNGRFAFGTGKFTEADTFVEAHTIAELIAYARKRAQHHERIAVQQVTFNRWEGHRLQFGPIYFLRSADDLGPTPLPGIGKGEYWCGKGISVLYTAPRPSFDPGPRAGSQRAPPNER